MKEEIKNIESYSELQYSTEKKVKKQSMVTAQIILFGATILACILTLATILSIIYANHYMEEKQMQLTEQGKKISKAFADEYTTGNLSTFIFELQVIENYMDAKVIMVDKNGIVVLTSPGTDFVLVGEKFVYPQVSNSVSDNNITVAQVEPKSGGFSVETMIVGLPMETGDIIGVFMCHPMSAVNASLTEIYGSGLTGCIIVFVVAVFISYFASKKIVKPLEEMNNMAKIIAGGNYNKRVTIHGENEVGELGKSFNEMAESIQNNDKIRRDFIANVSHDLRSPLTSMRGFLTALLDGTIPEEKQEKYLKIVLEETNRLTRITEGIVDLSQAQNNTISLDICEFDVNDMMREIINIMEFQINEKNIIIHARYAEKVTLVAGDRDKISRVFQNLMNNAIKFSEVGKIIEVETTINNRKVFVSVKDQGIGMSKEDQKYVFERFYKADVTRNEIKEGSGLGLAIAREFLFAHGEEISVKSLLGKGTTFVFSLALSDISI